MQPIRMCECGNQTFSAHQLCRHDVHVDETGTFISEHGCYDSERPYGPFQCTECGKEYDSLDNLPETVEDGQK